MFDIPHFPKYYIYSECIILSLFITCIYAYQENTYKKNKCNKKDLNR